MSARIRSHLKGFLVLATIAILTPSLAVGQTQDARTAKKLNAAYELLGEEQHQEAIKVLDGINTKRLKPSSAAIVFQIYAYAYAGQEKYEDAAKYFSMALETEGFEPAQQSKIRFNLAQIYMMLERWDDALAQLRAFFKETENPNSDAYYRLALVYYQMEEKKKALKPARVAIKKSRKPKEAHMRLLLALYMEHEEYKRATPILEKLVELYPKKPYYMQLSAVYNALGREMDSLACQQLAYVQDMLTTDREIRRLAQMYSFHDIPYRGALVLERALEEEAIEGDADAYELLGNSWLQAKEYDRALPPLLQAAEVSETGDLFARLGRVYIQREEWDKADDVLAQALDKGELDDEGNVCLLRGVALYQVERFKAARNQFACALDFENSQQYGEQWIKVIDRELE